MGDPNSIVPLGDVIVEETLTYVEVPIEILDRQVKFRNKEVVSVKVFWRNQQVERATWEAEADMIKAISSLISLHSSLRN